MENNEQERDKESESYTIHYHKIRQTRHLDT